jgi:hypothetical protein
MREWSAPDLGFTRDRLCLLRKSGKPDLRWAPGICQTPLAALAIGGPRTLRGRAPACEAGCAPLALHSSSVRSPRKLDCAARIVGAPRLARITTSLAMTSLSEHGAANINARERAGISYFLNCNEVCRAGHSERHAALSNPPASNKVRPAAPPVHKRRGRRRQALRPNRQRSICPRPPAPASQPWSAPGCAGTSAPRP